MAYQKDGLWFSDEGNLLIGPGMQAPAEKVKAYAKKTKEETSPAGRYKNDPTAEISRLLDEMERARRGISEVGLEPTSADIELQRKIQESLLGPAMAQISGQFGARGLSGSSLEAVQRAMMAGQIGLQSQRELRDMTMERAEFAMGKNKALFESLINQIRATTTPGAPGTQVKKEKKGGFWSSVGGILGGVAGSVLGPVGSAVGAKIGQSITGGAGTDTNYSYPYDDEYYNP